jgi:HlyD family secretion protein
VLLAAAADSTEADAYGNFEAEEVVVSAETQGRILRFDAMEGRCSRPAPRLAVVDTTQLALERDQLTAQRGALAART